MKAGVITWHHHHNLGGSLQAYAISTILTQYCDDVKIINYKTNNNDVSEFDGLKCMIGRIMQIFPYNFLPTRRYHYLRFDRKYLNLTEFVPKSELSGLNCKFDIIVCGSDQIWAPNVLDTSYMLDFIDNKKVRKVAYAPSIGLEKIPEHLHDSYKSCLCDFDYISIREEAGKVLLKDNFNIESTVVLDPTLLLSKEHYEKMENKPTGFVGKYIFCYFLNKNHDYREQIYQYAMEHKLKVVGVSVNPADSDWIETLDGMGPLEFLWLIHHAEVVFTDSYHGTIFSLLFEKEFFTFERFGIDDPINQNSRIYQLDRWFNISDRFLNKHKLIDECKRIDYHDIEKKLEDARILSHSYLERALL
ncbi:MAG: polysaccharide pyruvyl transferase family protein [Clostridia bacterium]|nr:polysaccharide pyruvyl transferase family protein [Clostridia bacterium]